jgi:hypothetical protein
VKLTSGRTREQCPVETFSLGSSLASFVEGLLQQLHLHQLVAQDPKLACTSVLCNMESFDPGSVALACARALSLY